MEQLIRIGMDTSKNFFQLHGVNAVEQVVLRKTLRRKELLPFLAKLRPAVIGLEACGGSHYWAREIQALGHEPRLVPAAYARMYVKRGKNDAADAGAVCEATGRPSMRFVPVKSAENQAALMLAGMRERMIRSRTQVSNRIRGYAAEFGLIAPKGMCKLPLLLARIGENRSIPELAREMFELLAGEYADINRRIQALDRRLMAWHRQNEASRRLAEQPGIGPIGGSLLVMKVPHPQMYRSARDFAAWMGLTPKDHSTANKQRLGAITRAGDEQLRSVLVSGAMAVLRHAKRRGSHPSPAVDRLLQHKSLKLAAVALANKNARIAWRLMVSGGRYDPLRHGPTSLAPCSAPSRTLARRLAVASQSLTAPVRGAPN
jgi:transposase